MRTSLTTIAAIGALAVPGTAMAQAPGSPGATGYGSTPVQIPDQPSTQRMPVAESQVLGEVGEVQSRPAAGESAPSAGEAPPAAAPTAPVEQAAGDALPFTGLDLGIVAALGAALLLVGVLMRRNAHPRA